MVMFVHGLMLIDRFDWTVGGASTRPYTCQFSRLRVENFDLISRQLTPTEQFLMPGWKIGAITAWNWHTFEKYVNLNQYEET